MNDPNVLSESSSIALFKHADDKIEKTRKEVGELLQKDLELTLKIDRLTDRVDHGVSVTGQKTLEKVTELATNIGKQSVTLEKMEEIVKTHDAQIKEINKGVFWLAFVGVLGGLLTMGFAVVKTFVK